MKKLFGKEWREEMKVALIGLAILTFLLTTEYINYGRELKNGQEPGQPLLSTNLYAQAGWFCAILGIVLGWLQMRAEKHPDLRAFLIHRPMTGTRILGTKIAAGLCLYALGAGLPMLGLLAVIWTPGHVAAPFEWPMTFPLTAIFLLGIVFYFAGMLTGARQARWYGSRGFGLGLAIFATIGVFNAREFWQALVYLAITGGILVLAVWGSFQSGGSYRNQPMPGKLALTAACVAAAIILVLVAASILIESLASESRDFSHYSHYAMTTNGVVYKVTSFPRDAEIVDLNGKTLLDDKTGRRMEITEFNRHIARAWATFANFGTLDEWRGWHNYLNGRRFYELLEKADKTLWYWTHDGRVVGYDSVTRRQTGTWEAPGNPIGASRATAGVMHPSDNSGHGRILASSTTVYRVHLENRALKAIFTVTNDDKIGGYSETWVETDDHNITSQGVIVVTGESIHLLDFDGRVQWSVPYQPSYPVYPRIDVFLLEPTNRFAIEFEPDRKADKKSGWKLPTRIEWVTAGEGISKSMDLPKLAQSKRIDFREILPPRLMPPLLLAAVALFVDSDRIWDPLCFIPAILCAIIGWGLGRRHDFPAGAQVGWVVFHLCFGLPGLLAFLSVQEWPARELCPHCKKFRVVDREKCPHCGADFAPPEKNGTEIFAPLAAD